jgi:hypothetical protein
VRELRARGSLYELLGVARDADEDAIRKAFRKFALLVHPDRNAAPGAEELFKRGQNAQTVLCDPHQRAHYDRYGETGSAGSGTAAAAAGGGGGGGGGGFGGGGAHGFAHGGDPLEEVLRAFFGGGGGFPGAGVHFRGGHLGGGGGGGARGGGPRAARAPAAAAGGGGGGAGETARGLFNMLPYVIMVLLMLWNVGEHRPVESFSLHATPAFSTQFVTSQAPHVPFFVKPAFAASHAMYDASPSRWELERNVVEYAERLWVHECAYSRANAGSSCLNLKNFFPARHLELTGRRR